MPTRDKNGNSNRGSRRLSQPPFQPQPVSQSVSPSELNIPDDLKAHHDLDETADGQEKIEYTNIAYPFLLGGPKEYGEQELLASRHEVVDFVSAKSLCTYSEEEYIHFLSKHKIPRVLFDSLTSRSEVQLTLDRRGILMEKELPMPLLLLTMNHDERNKLLESKDSPLISSDQNVRDFGQLRQWVHSENPTRILDMGRPLGPDFQTVNIFNVLEHRMEQAANKAQRELPMDVFDKEINTKNFGEALKWMDTKNFDFLITSELAWDFLSRRESQQHRTLSLMVNYCINYVGVPQLAVPKINGPFTLRTVDNLRDNVAKFMKNTIKDKNQKKKINDVEPFLLQAFYKSVMETPFSFDYTLKVPTSWKKYPLDIDVLCTVDLEARILILRFYKVKYSLIADLVALQEVRHVLSRYVYTESRCSGITPFWDCLEKFPDDRDSYLRKKHIYTVNDSSINSLKYVHELLTWFEEHEQISEGLSEIGARREQTNDQKLKALYNQMEKEFKDLIEERDRWLKLIAPQRAPVPERTPSPPVEEVEPPNLPRKLTSPLALISLKESTAPVTLPVEPESVAPEFVGRKSTTSTRPSLTPLPPVVLPTELKEPTPSGGVVNAGFHCYFISLFKSLIHNKKFKEAPNCSRYKTDCVACYFRQMGQRSYEGEQIHSNLLWDFMKENKDVAKFSDQHSQHDVAEFLGDVVHNCDNHVINLLTFTLSYTHECASCQHRKSMEPQETCLLKLPIVSPPTKDPDSPNEIQVSGLLEEAQTLTAVDAICGKCGSDKMYGYLGIGSYPEILVVQLERFKHEADQTTKCAETVSSSMAIIVKGVKYRLCSVIVHIGDNVGEGHYYCYVETESNEWWRMDDDKITRASDEMMNQDQDNTYLLFYSKQEADTSIAFARGSLARRATKTASETRTSIDTGLESIFSETVVECELGELSPTVKTIDMKAWGEVHDVGMCLVVVNVKIKSLYMRVLATKLFYGLQTSQPDIDVCEDVQWKLNNLSHRPGFGDREWKRRDKGVCNALNLIFLMKRSSFTAFELKHHEAKELFLAAKTSLTDYSPQRWLKNFVVKRDRGNPVFLYDSLHDRANSIRFRLRYLLAKQELVDEIILCLLMKVISCCRLTVSSLRKYVMQEFRPMLNTLIQLEITRNSVVHLVESQTLTEQGRQNFMNGYDWVLNSFRFDAYYKLNADEMLNEMRNPTVTSNDFFMVANSYNELLESHKQQGPVKKKLARARDKCLSSLAKCSNKLNVLKDSTDNRVD